jgi:hypothetical protein
MTIINGMSDSIKGKLASFENYLKNFSDSQNTKENIYKNFDKEKLLNKKTNRNRGINYIYNKNLLI